MHDSWCVIWSEQLARAKIGDVRWYSPFYMYIYVWVYVYLYAIGEKKLGGVGVDELTCSFHLDILGSSIEFGI